MRKQPIRITILGCGDSNGTPTLGCRCKVCISGLPKNRRTRASILVEVAGKRLLVDSSPDLREQSLRHNITAIDAVIYTHAHFDHIGGMEELRIFNLRQQQQLNVYSSAATLEELQQRVPYAFTPPGKEYPWSKTCLIPHVVKPYEPFIIEGIEVMPFTQQHGQGETLGLKFGNVAYSTDVNGLSPRSKKLLKGLDLWIVDCLRDKEAPTHAHKAMTLGWIKALKPKRAVLTHMSHEYDYEALKAELPKNVEPAYDGMCITV